MLTFAYCAQSFLPSVRRAAGVEPLLCPPVTVETIDPLQFVGYDLVYFKLHGLPGQPYWYGDHWITALSAAQLRHPDLQGALQDTVVFVANCHLPQSPMLQALLETGARAIVGGSGSNYAGRTRVYGADLLGMQFSRWLKIGFNPRNALRLAKIGLHFGRQDRVTRDTLDFRIYT